MKSLISHNPYLRKTPGWRFVMREDARQSSIFEGAAIPEKKEIYAPIRRRTALSKKAVKGT
jgi:hypothetical protein